MTVKKIFVFLLSSVSIEVNVLIVSRLRTDR